MQLLLFDIDGTLIRSDGAGRAAMVMALEQVFGTAGPAESYRMDGKTDPLIITDLLTAAGMDAAQIEAGLDAVYKLMVANARTVFPTRSLKPCPGIIPLLAELNRQEDVILGLLTGNISQTAPLKLAAAGIDPAQFRIGAYGSDDRDRNQLTCIAMERAGALVGQPFTGDNTFVIGDTPADILCARAGQAKAVAVASGWYSATTLAQYHPDYLFDSLADTSDVLHTLLGRTADDKM